MIKNDKQYSIDGWAVSYLIDILKSLKHFVEQHPKNYKKEEFLEVLDYYDMAIRYMVNLSLTEKQSDIYNEDELPKWLEQFHISIDELNKRDESNNQLGEGNAKT